jgi:hypothetical protein
MFDLHDCSAPCVLILYLYVVCLEREEEQNKKKEFGKERKNMEKCDKEGWK